MNVTQFARSAAKWMVAGAGFGAVMYATYVGVTWCRYGKVRRIRGEAGDALLDTVMPACDISERHEIRVVAPPEVTLSAASEIDLDSCVLVRGIFKGREWILRSNPDDTTRPQGLLAKMMSLGWGLLAEAPGREIVVGAVTRPWDANPVFRALPPDEFAGFEEPGYVKIVWTLRADPTGSNESIFRTETRAIATDPQARKKFRWYWSFLSPGIIAIRAAMLPAVKGEAERRWRGMAA